MNSLNLTNTGGVAYSQDVVKFMQDAYTAAIAALGSAIGDNAILSGCVADNNGNISAGVIALNGEVLPFAGGLLLANFDVAEVTANRQYYDGAQKPFFVTRAAVMSAATGVPFENFTRINTLKNLSQFSVSDDYSKPSETIIPTMTALYNLAQAIGGLSSVPKGAIMMWSGSVASVPAGWALCNGANGMPDLRDKFIVGAGNSYAVGATGGEAQHTLTQSELPAAGLSYRDWYYPESQKTLQAAGATNYELLNGYNKQIGAGATDTDNTWVLYKDKTTGNMGSGAAHENRPPYFALCFIQKL